MGRKKQTARRTYASPSPLYRLLLHRAAVERQRQQAAEGRIEESKESEGEETEEDEDQEPPEDTEDEMEALAQLPASSSPQQQEFEDKQSSGGDVDIIGTTEEESEDEGSGEQQEMEGSIPATQLPSGRAANNGAGPSQAPASRTVESAVRSGASAVAAAGQFPGRQPSAQTAAVNGRGNACNTRSVAPDSDTSGEAPHFLRVSGAYTPEAAAAELAADVAATSPIGRRQVAADTAWAAAADLAADVAGTSCHAAADAAAPPLAITSPLRKSPQKFKSVTTLHRESMTGDAQRLLSRGSCGSTGGETSAAAVAQQPSAKAQLNSAPSQDQAIVASRDESRLIDMSLLQRMRSLHASPDRLKCRTSHSGQDISEATASRQVPGEAELASGTTAGTAAAAEGGPVMHAGGPTAARAPGDPAMAAGRPAATAGALGGLAGTDGGPATAAEQGAPTAESRGDLATGLGGPFTAGIQGGPSTAGEPVSASQGFSAEGASWLVNSSGRFIHEAPSEAVEALDQQGGEALTDVLEDSEQTMTEDEDEDDEDGHQSDKPMDRDYVGGTGPCNTGDREARDLPRQPSYHWPTRGEMEVRRSGFSGASGAEATIEQRGVVLGLSAQARMRDLLEEVLNAMAKRVHKDKRRIFQEQVDQMYVPDYCKYVAPEDEVWTELIRQRVRNGQHTSLAAMLKDFEQMAANARAYNTPGAGSLGGTYLIDFAEEILKVVREEGERRAAQFAELDPLVADEAVRGLRLEKVQGYVRPTIVLPEGFTVRVVKSQAKPRGYMEYVASCPIHGSGKRLDRVGEIITFLSAHSGCREEWNEWAPHPDETRVEYEERVRDTFHFRRKEVPPHLINTVTVPGMYGSQRTVVARPGSSREDAPNVAAQRTWHAAADHPTRKALIERIEQSVARMRAAFRNRFYPPVHDLEQVLYINALSEEDYTCKADFDDRLQRAIGLAARQRRHAQGGAPPATPMSPNAADRNFRETCDVFLTAAAQDDSNNGASHDNVTGSDQHMPSEAAAAPAGAAAAGLGVARPDPRYTELRTMLSTGSHPAASALPSLAVQTGSLAPPIVTSIPVSNHAPSMQAQQQQLRTVVAGQIARGVPLLPGSHSVHGSSVANHPLPQPDAAAASRQPSAHLPERQSSRRDRAPEETPPCRDAAANVPGAAARASVVRTSQDALREQLHIGRPIAPIQARPQHPPAQRQQSLPKQAVPQHSPAQRQPGLPNQAMPQHSPAQRQPSMPAAQQGSAEPVIGRQGSVGALPTAVIRQGSVGSAAWPHRVGSTTWAVPGRPIAPYPGASHMSELPQAQTQQNQRPVVAFPLKDMWLFMQPRVTSQVANRFISLCGKIKEVSSVSDRDLWARELQECLGAQLLTAFYDWQQANKAAASNSPRSPKCRQASSPRAAAHPHVPAHAVPNGHPTTAPANAKPAQQLAAGQTHYPGGRSSATQSNLASISSTPARLRPILRAPAMVLPRPQPQLQQQQQPQPRLVANDIASTSTGATCDVDQPVIIMQKLVRTHQTMQALVASMAPYLSQLMRSSVATSTAEMENARLQAEVARLKEQLAQSEAACKKQRLEARQLSAKLREASRENQAQHSELVWLRVDNPALLRGRLPPTAPASGTGMQQPDQEPLPSQLPAEPQPQPEAEVAFEAAPSEGRAPLEEDLIARAIAAVLGAAHGVPWEGTPHEDAAAEGTSGSGDAAEASTGGKDAPPSAAAKESLVSIKRERSEDGGSPGSKRSRADHDASAGEARRAEGAAAGPEVRLGRPDAPGAAGTVDLIDLCESPSPETHMAEPPRE